MTSLSNLAANAKAEQYKMILGWLFDFRALLFSFHENKHTAWSNAIIIIFQRGHSYAKELETNIRQFVYTSLVFPHINHFLGRICDLFAHSKSTCSIKLNASVIEDLKLMLFFLQHAKQGISMNLLAFRKPTKVHISNSCPAGLC
eukprot:1897467-Ditylum_brightwellii.AAC.1